MSERIVREEERISIALRALYEKYGYLPYKMSKFEEYDLYVANKEFLVGDGVITFNDTDGKLLALKPDVTLSIIRSGKDGEEKRKVYYDENVYRISGKTKQFKEIRQVGLECVGDLGLYDVYETVCLAAGSLQAISKDFVLDLSHLGIVSAVLESCCASEGFQRSVMARLAEKNVHETESLCEKYGVSAEDKEKLLALFTAYGDGENVLKTLAPICRKGKAKEAYKELQSLCKLLSLTPFAGNIRLDFSVVNDMTYYSGVVFKGFIDGVAEGVLSGGRYDGLMRRMDKRAGAIGFAVYLDQLEGFHAEKREQDVDILILYNEKTPTLQLVRAVEALVKKGNTVRVQRNAEGVRFAQIRDMRGGRDD